MPKLSDTFLQILGNALQGEQGTPAAREERGIRLSQDARANAENARANIAQQSGLASSFNTVAPGTPTVNPQGSFQVNPNDASLTGLVPGTTYQPIARSEIQGMQNPQTGALSTTTIPVPRGATYRGLNPSYGQMVFKQGEQQDKLEQEARQGFQSIRGDASLKAIEEQRDAAIIAYNRIQQIKQSGGAPNPIDYMDLLGQIYKARTGAAPTNEIFSQARQATAQGQFDKAYTFMTGNQAPATTPQIMSSLEDMVRHMGIQADTLHDGYMQVHGASIFPSRLAPDRKAKLANLTRGISFSQATGVQPLLGADAIGQNPSSQSSLGATNTQDHNAAIQWAQANPNDPRAQPILLKANAALGLGNQ